LLGGPQAGIASGDPALVARLRSHPLFRALRVDKMTYAALEATLGAYLREDFDAVPLLRILRASAASVRARCERVATRLKDVAGLSAEIVEVRSVIGGGAAPGKTLPSFAISLAADGVNATELASRLRKHVQPVIARVDEGRVLLDLRTVIEDEDAVVAEAVQSALQR
jgi:L-seryl-tRNA(Ser) seleniumtransferase